MIATVELFSKYFRVGILTDPVLQVGLMIAYVYVVCLLVFGWRQLVPGRAGGFTGGSRKHCRFNGGRLLAGDNRMTPTADRAGPQGCVDRRRIRRGRKWILIGDRTSIRFLRRF